MNANDRAKEVSAQNNGNRNVGVSQAAIDKATAPTYVLDNDPIEYPMTTGSHLSTTLDLCHVINALFTPVFKDYAGCNIQLHNLALPAPNARGVNGIVGPQQAHTPSATYIPRMEVELYFAKGASIEKCAKGAIDNVLDLVSGKNNSIANRNIYDMTRLNAMGARANPGKPMTLTDPTKEMLEPFFLDIYKKKVPVTVKVEADNGEQVTRTVQVNKPRYDDALIYTVAEAQPQYIYQGNQVNYVKVTNLDLILLLRKIYGSKNELGHWVDYNVRIVRPISNFSNAPANVLYALLEVSRLDCSEVESLVRTMGMMNIASGLPIIRV